MALPALSGVWLDNEWLAAGSRRGAVPERDRPPEICYQTCPPGSVMPFACSAAYTGDGKGDVRMAVVTIGADPHKGSHTAAVIDRAEVPPGRGESQGVVPAGGQAAGMGGGLAWADLGLVRPHQRRRARTGDLCYRCSARKAMTVSTAWVTYGSVSYRSICSLVSSHTRRFGSLIRSYASRAPSGEQ